MSSAAPPDESAVASTLPLPPPSSPRATTRGAAAVQLAVTALLLIALLLPVRAKTVGYWFLPTLLDWRGQLPGALASAAYDILFVLGFTALAFALLGPANGTRRWLRPHWIVRGHLALAVVTLITGLANIAVVKWLGQPFTFPWLYYSDFLRSVDAITAMAAAVDWWQVTGAVVAGGAFAWGARRCARWSAARWTQHRGLRLAVYTAAVVALGGGLAGRHWLKVQEWGAGVVSNPVWAFVQSCIRAARAPELFSMPTRFGPDDFVAPAAPAAGAPGSLLPEERVVPRNVVFIVLESVGAAYVGLYGAEYGATPELDRRRERAAIFEHAYAPAPATHMTLVSLLGGVYPRVSFRMTIADLPDGRLPAITRRLRDRGYTTGFFASAPLDFQNADAFLAAHGAFDAIEDSRQRTASPPPWDARAGTGEEATVTSLIRWIEERETQPYFATFWTMQTHFPYYVAETERPIVADAMFNRYLNALAETDRALGRFLAWLDESGRAEDTLVVVLGDHGEAFGQHKNYGHAGQLYEENIRIPLVLLHPTLFAGRRYDTPAGVIDLAPTVTDVLRLEPDPAWQGRSLFSTQRTGRTYFFAAWSDFLLGYREGDRKLVYNTTAGTHALFDLVADPGETRNLLAAPNRAATMPDADEITQRLAAWVQFVEQWYRARR